MREAAPLAVRIDPGSRATVLTTVYPAEIDWIVTVRARFGIVWYQTVLYATGGAAYAGTLVNKSAFPTFSGSDTRSHLGWTVGAGAALALTDGWSFAVEYRRIDLGSHRYILAIPSGFPPVFTDAKFTADQVTARLNWQFMQR